MPAELHPAPSGARKPAITRQECLQLLQLPPEKGTRESVTSELALPSLPRTILREQCRPFHVLMIPSFSARDGRERPEQITDQDISSRFNGFGCRKERVAIWNRLKIPDRAARRHFPSRAREPT